MKKKSIFILLFLLITNIVNAQYIKDVKEHLNISNIIRAIEYQGDVYVLGSYTSDKEGVQCGVTVIKNDSYVLLPTTYTVNGIEKKLYFTSNNITFDKNGSIWIAGKSLYCYKDEKWNEYYINDEYKEFRKIQQHCVDIFGNVWFQTWVRVNSSTGFTEIYKYNGINYTKLMGTKYPASFSSEAGPYFQTQTLTPLSDGRVMIFRLRGPADDDWIEGEENGEIVIFNQDGQYNYLKIKTNDSDEYKDWSKYVVSIFEESANKYWFNLNFISWYDNPATMTGGHFCCGGLTMFDNGNWTFFDESKGLTKKYDGTFNPTFNTIKYKENILIQTLGQIYNIKNNNLESMNQNLISDNSYLIPANSYFALDSNINNYWKGFFTNKSDYPTYSPMFVKDNELWLVTEKGILVINADITGIKDNKNDFEIYPNPADNYINLPDGIKNYKILNSTGKIITEGDKCEKVNINGFIKGIYFIRITDRNDNIILKKFIKIY
ncbi:MAG: T9SS type A sorting domain-containing protein [bacterium]